MKRARQQQAGYVFRKGAFWYVRYRERVVLENGAVRRVHRSRRLTDSYRPYRTKRAVEQLAEKILRPLNDGAVVAESTMSLNRFIETAYLPYAEQQKRRSTFLGYRNIWKRYIKPDGDRALREFRTFECEQMLMSIARQEDLVPLNARPHQALSQWRIRYAGDRVCSTLQSYARSGDPRARPAGELMPIRSRKKFRCWLFFLNPPQRSSLGGVHGRPQGRNPWLSWEGYDGHAIEVKQSVWRNHVGEPKREKSKGTIR